MSVIEVPKNIDFRMALAVKMGRLPTSYASATCAADCMCMISAWILRDVFLTSSEAA